MSKLKITNNAVSRLSANISSADTSISLLPGDGAKFPVLGVDEWFPATFVKVDGTLEIVRVTARATDVLTVVRGQEATAEISFSAGDRVEHRFTAAAYTEENARVEAIADAAMAAAIEAGDGGAQLRADLLADGGGNIVAWKMPGIGAIRELLSAFLGRWHFANSRGLSVAGTPSSNSTAIENAISYLMSTGVPGEIRFESGAYKFARPINYNPFMVQFIGTGGVTLDFSSVSDFGLRPQAGGTAGESVARNKMRNSGGFTLLGNSTITLLDISSTSGLDTACLTFRDITFDTFNVGVFLGTNGWGLCLDNYAFKNGPTHIYEAQDNPPTVTNFGERNVFVNGKHEGAGLAYYSRNFNSDAHFIGASFDSARSIDIARGARVSISNSHIETQADTGINFLVDGDSGGFTKTSLTIRDSTLVLTGSFRSFSVFACGLSYSVGNGGLLIDGLDINCDSSFGLPGSTLVQGPGRVSARNITGRYDLPSITIADSMNVCAAGNFTGFTLLSQTDLSPISGAFPPTIDTDPANAHSAVGSLKMSSNGTAFVGAFLEKPVRPGQLVMFSAWHKRDAVTAPASFVFQIQVLDRNRNVIVINDEIIFTGTAPYSYYCNATLRHNRMPIGAETIRIAFMVKSNGTGQTAWVDDIKLNIID